MAVVPLNIVKPAAFLPRARPPRSNHRPSLGGLFGREATLTRLTELIEGGARLITVLGPPGIGKTRVASGLLDRLAPAYARLGGAFYCELAPARTELDLVFTVAAIVGDRSDLHLPHAELAARLAELLAGIGPTLLVLDNFEQLVPVAHVVHALCRAAPALHVVVTSRERLGVEGEVLCELPPLDCPDPEEGPRDADETSAMALFLARVREAGGSTEDRASAAAIVRRLQGIPLALELAAARTRVLSLSELASRLAHGHGVLSQVRRRVEGHQATLESTLEWSWNLLSAAEQDALARAAVFVGPFSAAHAEGVLGPDAVDLLAGLRDKSLLFATEDHLLDLYVSVRELAVRKLTPDRAAEARRAHAAIYAATAHRYVLARSLQDERPGAAPYAALRAERENLLAALAHLREGPAEPFADVACAVSLVHALPGEQCLVELTRALERLPDGARTARAHVLDARQWVENSLGHYAACRADLAALRAIAATPGMRAYALVSEGIQLRYQGEARRAWECHAAAEREIAGLPRLKAMNDACMGRLSCDLGDPERSRRCNERAYAAAEGFGDRFLAGLALANLAQLEQEQQAFARAEELLEQALARLRETGEMHYEAVYAGVCGDLYAEMGQPDAARRWYAQGARFLGRFLTHRQTAFLHAAAAGLEASVGDAPAAAAHLRVARAGAAQLDNPLVRLVVALHEHAVAVHGGARAPAEAFLASLAGGPDADLVATSFDVRFAVRMLRRALARPVDAEDEGRRLVVQREGLWFSVDDGARVDLSRRGALRKILVALCERRAREGSGASVEALAEAGWPGERMLVEAAATRVRVAIATLRRLGLRSALVTRDDGYHLATELRVAWAPAPERTPAPETPEARRG